MIKPLLNLVSLHPELSDLHLFLFAVLLALGLCESLLGFPHMLLDQIQMSVELLFM
jgi:hypothetical protein